MAQITGSPGGSTPYEVAPEDVVPTAAGAVAKPRASARLRSGQSQARLIPYIFLAIPLIMYFVWVIGPMCYSFWMSLTNSDGISQQDFVRLANYRRMWDDNDVRTAFWNNVRWLVAFITIPTVCGLALAVLLNRDLPGMRFIKAGIFSPMVLSSVVIAQVWSWMYFPNDGLFAATLNALGFAGDNIDWLGDPDLATYCIIGAAMWRQIGYVMLLYLAGLKNVDPSLVDAARVDGASNWRSFKDIVLPLLQPVTVIVLVVSIIDALRAFDLVDLMTDGGPYGQSSVMAHRMYEEAFNNYNMGYAAAIAVVLMLISMIFIFTYLSRMVREELEF